MAEDHGAFKTNPRDLPPILASCGVLSTPLHGSLSGQERSARVRFGIRSRRFYPTGQDGLRYSRLGPIRAAERPAKRCECGRICGHRVPEWLETWQHLPRRDFSFPCFPASVFCLPPSCCPCRSLSLDWGQRRCCGLRIRNSPATHPGDWSPKHWSPGRTRPLSRCWPCFRSRRR